MTTYVIVDNKVHTPEPYQEYIANVSATVAQYGGEYKVRGGDIILTDSDWQPERVIVIAFDSSEQALAWVNAEETQALHAMRRKYAESKMIVVEGI